MRMVIYCGPVVAMWLPAGVVDEVFVYIKIYSVLGFRS